MNVAETTTLDYIKEASQTASSAKAGDTYSKLMTGTMLDLLRKEEERMKLMKAMVISVGAEIVSRGCFQYRDTTLGDMFAKSEVIDMVRIVYNDLEDESRTVEDRIRKSSFRIMNDHLTKKSVAIKEKLGVGVSVRFLAYHIVMLMDFFPKIKEAKWGM